MPESIVVMARLAVPCGGKGRRKEGGDHQWNHVQQPVSTRQTRNQNQSLDFLDRSSLDPWTGVFITVVWYASQEGHETLRTEKL